MEKPTKLLFVCLGNICRSPSAEGIMAHLIKQQCLESYIEVDSAGTYGGHAGELPDRRMRMHADRRGYNLNSRSRQVMHSDFEDFDFILAMDDANYDNLCRMAPDLESRQKIHRMTDYCRKLTVDHVPDPYYSGSDGFEQVLDILEDACAGLLESVKQKL